MWVTSSFCETGSRRKRFWRLGRGEGRLGPSLRLWPRRRGPSQLPCSATPPAGRRWVGCSEERENPVLGPVASAASLLGGSGFPSF